MGTTINIVVTVACAYPLSRKEFAARNAISVLVVFTMYFSGGLIPTYLLVRNLGLLNTRWALLLPVALSPWNMVLCRTYMVNSIPDELYEAASLDGCSPFGYLTRVVVQLSKPILAVLVLYYGVGHWNAYFNAMIYLKDQDLWPLTLFLREILINSVVDPTIDVYKRQILFSYVHGTGVFLDEEEKDPDKRYKLVTKVDYAPGCGYMAVGFSRDGIHFGELRKWTGRQPQADTHNFVFRDHRTGRFVLITRIWRNGQRIAAKCESSDFINWSDPVEIFRGRGFEDQIYSMPVFVYNGIYMGIPSVYHEGDVTEENYDTVDLRLAYSVNLDNWEEAVIGENFIERGSGNYPEGEFDCGCIYAAAPVPEGKRLYFY